MGRPLRAACHLDGRIAMPDEVKVHEFRSDTSPTVIYACGRCRFTSLSEELARACCSCGNCGGVNKGPGRGWCDDCARTLREQKEADFDAKQMALPVVEDQGEPVCVGDRFYESAQEAAEAVWDDGEDPTRTIAYPCTVTKVPTPNIAEIVEEGWAVELGDDDDWPLSKEMADLVAATQAALEAQAPTCWMPRTKERISLPAVEASAESAQ